MTDLATTLRRARFDARMWAGRTPGVHHLISLRNWRRVRDAHALVTRRTELVMDGFPSSGNSFAIAALKEACRTTSTPLPAVAHHLHNPGQVRAAVRLGVPVLLLVREPRALTVSARTRWPSLTAAQVLRGYIGYHERLRPVWTKVAVADFSLVVADFGAVTRGVNERFGLRLPEFDHTVEAAQVVYDSDEAGRAARRAAAEVVEAELDEPRVVELLAGALALYHEVSESSRSG